jgi:hypothetical protein
MPQKVIHFTPTDTFFSNETKSQYVKGLSYRLEFTNVKLKKLVDGWLKDGKVKIVEKSRSGISGSDKKPSLLQSMKKWFPFLIIPVAFFTHIELLLLLPLIMAVTHPVAVRTSIADHVVDKLDVGTTDPNGDLRFLTDADAEVALLQFSATAFGGATNGTATANAITSDDNATGGTIAKATLRDRDNTVIIQCSVTATAGGGDIELSSVVVSSGQTVSLSSLTYTAPD